jgi:transcriptional regulator with XRE-family HTH domain
MSPSPVVARWELSRRLAARRKELGVEVKEITTALGFTRNYWSAVEHDRTLLAEEKLRLLFEVLQFDDAMQARLLELRELAKDRGWWDEYSSLDDGARRFYGMEAGADRIRIYDGHVIPGILQIDAYTRAIIEADPFYSAVEIDTVVKIRNDRQQQLRKRQSVNIYVILSEAALRQQVAGPEVQRRQLQHLIDLMADEDLRVELRVLPFDTNPGVLASSSTMLIFDYANAELPAVAWQEAVRLLDSVKMGDEQFRRLDLAWHDGLRRALEPSQSEQLVSRVVSDLSGEPRIG